MAEFWRSYFPAYGTCKNHGCALFGKTLETSSLETFGEFFVKVLIPGWELFARSYYDGQRINCIVCGNTFVMLVLFIGE